MILRLVDRRQFRPTQDPVQDLFPVFESLVQPMGLPGWGFDLVLVDDDAMEGLNGQFRGKDGRTDVLSFSYLLEEGPEPCSLQAGQSFARRNLWVDRFSQPNDDDSVTSIGEVILAPEFIVNRCTERDWPVRHEFPLLVIHGSLHLLGWDHHLEDEKEAMRDLEEERLLACDLPHPLREEERKRP